MQGTRAIALRAQEEPWPHQICGHADIEGLLRAAAPSLSSLALAAWDEADCLTVCYPWAIMPGMPDFMPWFVEGSMHLPEVGAELPELPKLELLSLHAVPVALPHLALSRSLRLLYLYGCTNLEDSVFSCLRNLRYLLLTDLLTDFLPSTLSTLTALRTLKVEGCINVVDVPSLHNLKHLTHLSLSGSSSMLRLPLGMDSLSNLLKLQVWNCPTITSIDSISSLCQLQDLDVGSCTGVQPLLERISSLTKLTRLVIDHCTQVTVIVEIAGMTDLRVFSAKGCDQLVNVRGSDISSLVSLEVLDLSLCSRLLKVPVEIGYLARLRVLDLSRNDCFCELPDSVGGLSSLQHVDLFRNFSLRHIPSCLGQLTNLTHLDIGLTKVDMSADMCPQRLQVYRDEGTE